MLLHEMNYVYEVYRQRSFTKAAQALYIAQPSLSQMVRKAEARIGAPIFDRSTSPIGVTELGGPTSAPPNRYCRLRPTCSNIWTTRKNVSPAH